MAYGELLKNFKSIRGYMREFYVYGFRSRENIKQKSARSYDNERRRIDSWMGESMSFSRSANGKAQFISVDTRKIEHNPLYNAFKAKSFTDNDILLHFFLLDILDDKDWLSFRDIVSSLFREYLYNLEKAVVIEEATVRNKLNEYVKEGIVECKKVGKSHCFKRATSNIDFSEWKDAIQYYSEIGTLGVIGSYLLDNSGMKEFAKESFKYRFKHHYLVHVLESQILYELFEAMNQHNAIKLSVVSRQAKNKSLFEVYPVKIYQSTQNGRMYLLGYELKQEDFRFFRLDNIDEVKLLGYQAFHEIIQSKYEEIKPYLWGVSINNSDQIEHLEMILKISTEDEHILRRLNREKRNGQVSHIGECRYKYEVDTYDAMELLPWIRSFIGRIEKVNCTNKSVTRTFYKDLDEMYNLYFGGEDSDF